jgi:hypothetical protein
MICHGELARLRPSTRYLTSFYLTISVGGALGGLFVNLIAPMLFTYYWELPLGLALCFTIYLGLILFLRQGRRWITTGLMVVSLAAALRGFFLGSIWRHSAIPMVGATFTAYCGEGACS